jgi:uncharacterized protein YndB with AHSA1/START domain
MTQPDPTALTIRRVVAAGVERVFAAWTTPELLRAWWGPAGVTCVGAELDLRVGGAYRIGNQLPDGSVVWIEGTFDEVAPPRRLVYSWRIGDEPVSRVTVEFVAVNGSGRAGCEVTLTHERIHSVDARDDHARGWAGCLDGLGRWADGATE